LNQTFRKKWNSSIKWIFSPPILVAAVLVACAKPEPEAPASGVYIDAPSPTSASKSSLAANTGQATESRDTPGVRSIAEEALDRLTGTSSQRPLEPPNANSGGREEDFAQEMDLLEAEALTMLHEALNAGAPSSTTGDGQYWDGSHERELLTLLMTLEGQEAEALALQWLQMGPSPRAFAELARYLGNAAPGVHDATIRLAAEERLAMAAALSDVPGEVFQVLGEFGDAGTVSMLLDMPWHRDAYASVALALVPDGSGLVSIIEDARLFEEGSITTHGRLAVELLAQEAHRDSAASELLLELAERQLIPADMWSDLMATAAGQQQISLIRPSVGLRGIHTILRPEGNQVLYRVARTTPPSTNIHQFRLALLDGLRMYAPSQPGGG
jgi:hypothetical protein